jgi:formylglycine-generating enzyme required for sulfatase activity
MAGNVAEYCRDRYEADYYSHSPVEDPLGPDDPTAVFVVIRGGSWSSSLDLSIRAADRLSFRSGSNKTIGFRIVKEID